MIKKELAISDTGFVFDPTTGDSYSMNSIGKDILSMLKEDKVKEEIEAEILGKYEIDSATFENDYYDFISTLQDQRLITE